MRIDKVEIEQSETPTEADAQLLRQGLSNDNRQFLGEPDHRGLALIVRERGRTVGGLIGETGRRHMFIDMLWLDLPYRRCGLGTRLLARAELEAQHRGCRVAWLDTYDFQARGFYERHGYVIFGELEGLANGHCRYFMCKQLAASADHP